jgi:hypothetical protein
MNRTRRWHRSTTIPEVLTVTKNKRVQGESPRIETCEAGGTHVLSRPAQHYCDRCRPENTERDLVRQRRRRARLKGRPAPVAAPTAVVPAAPSPQPRPAPPSLKAVLAACLREIEQQAAQAQPAIEQELKRRAHLRQSLEPALGRRDTFRDLHRNVTAAVSLAARLEA